MRLSIISNILSMAGAVVLTGSFATGCVEEVDNAYSRFPSVIDISANADEIVLNDETPDEVALTLTWTDAADYGKSYMTYYTYSYDLREKTHKQSEDIFEGEYTRKYTHAELQKMLVEDFGYTTSTWGTMVFSISATYEGSEGDAVVLPDEDQVTVRVKTYGPKQFAADRVFISGTAVGETSIELQPTASNPALYVFDGDLSAGGFNFPVIYGDENNVIVPADLRNVTMESGNTGEATILGNDEALYSWLVDQADSYRITLNITDRTVTVLKTADIMEIDRIFMAGTAVNGGEAEVERTLENDAVYAWYGELSAGTLCFPIEFGEDRNLTIVPDGDGHEFTDGQGNAFTTVRSAQADGHYWEIAETGIYRIVLDTDARTLSVYSPATDIPNMTVIYKRTAGDADDNYTCEVTALYMWSSNTYNSGSRPVGGDYVLKQSLANPRLFVYRGSVLKSGENLKFIVSDNWNNEYAFGAGDSGASGSDVLVPVTLGSKFSPIYGGQGNNRYTYFQIPENANYVEVYVGPQTAHEQENALSKAWALEDSYVLFYNR